MSPNESDHSGSNGRQTGTAAAPPDPEVVPKASRRKFTAEYKLRILVEAESTCVVYGMPRAVAEAGLADEILPLHELPAAIAREAGT